MTKDQLQEIVAHFLEAAPKIIVAARQHSLDRSCMICGVGQGEQHTQDCALWGMVAARIDFRRLSENRPKSSAAEPTYTETMAMLEGGNLNPSAPEPVFAESPASDEWWPA